MATETWYRVTGEKIESREVVKATAKTVTYLDPPWKEGVPPVERRANRDSSYEHWFDNLRDAVKHVRSRLISREAAARQDAARLAQRLADFNAAHPET